MRDVRWGSGRMFWEGILVVYWVYWRFEKVFGVLKLSSLEWSYVCWEFRLLPLCSCWWSVAST